MIISKKKFNVKDNLYFIRSAVLTDAKSLSKVRLKIDGETQNLDREQGEGFIDENGFEQLIKVDSRHAHHLFLVATVDDNIVGYSRCEGNSLRRFSHKVEFGVAVLQEYWGYSIGKNLLKESIAWCDAFGIRKVSLNVLESNKKAIALYEKHGFENEGVLKNDKMFSDGKFQNTVVMGRFT